MPFSLQIIHHKIEQRKTELILRAASPPPPPLPAPWKILFTQGVRAEECRTSAARRESPCARVYHFPFREQLTIWTISHPPVGHKSWRFSFTHSCLKKTKTKKTIMLSLVSRSKTQQTEVYFVSCCSIMWLHSTSWTMYLRLKPIRQRGFFYTQDLCGNFKAFKSKVKRTCPWEGGGRDGGGGGGRGEVKSRLKAW